MMMKTKLVQKLPRLTQGFEKLACTVVINMFSNRIKVSKNGVDFDALLYLFHTKR